jgi:hypothetical protein
MHGRAGGIELGGCYPSLIPSKQQLHSLFPGRPVSSLATIQSKGGRSRHREVCNGGADLTDCSIRGRLSVRQRFISSSADRYHGVPPEQVGGVLEDVRGAGEEPVGGMPSPSSRIAAAAAAASAWSPTSTSDGRSRPSAARSRSVTPKSLHALIDAQIFPVIEGIHSLTAR